MSSERIARVALCIEPYFSLHMHANPRLRTVYRQRKWPPLAPVRKIMALGRTKMALGCKIIALGLNVF